MKFIKLDFTTLKWHLLGWVIYISYVCLIIIPYPEYYALDIIIANLVALCAFYSSLLYLKYFSEKRYLKAFLGVSFSFALYFTLRALMYILFISIFKRKDPPQLYSEQFWIEGLFVYVQFFLYALGYFFLKRNTDKEKLLRIASEQKAQMYAVNLALGEKILLEEKMRHIAEANFLRAQINPHFLQNTLNFLYAQALTGKSGELSEGILLLSEIMHYSLQNQGDGMAKVPLQDEIRHMENYIAINQLRFNGQLQIGLIKTGEPQNLTIIPLVLLTLLENAFKHGELQNAAYPLSIRIDIDNDKGQISFEVHNKIKSGPREKSTGIGIDNTRRRLDTAYPGRYRLETVVQQGFYKATLQIQLHPQIAA